MIDSYDNYRLLNYHYHDNNYFNCLQRRMNNFVEFSK